MTGRPLGAAVVTGATSGIGLAIAQGLARRGFGVFATGRENPGATGREDPGATGRGAPAEPLGEHISFIAADHLDPEAPDVVADALDDRYGPLTALVNNVGRRHNDLIGELQHDSLLETFALNTVSHMLLTQRLAPLMAGGSIVNVSSRLAAVGMSGVSGYAASKGAINAFTVSAAVELAPLGIRVNAIAPGMTKTPLIEAWLNEQPDPERAEGEVAARIPLGRLATPEDVAGAAVFLASPESGYITGEILRADGGYTIG